MINPANLDAFVRVSPRDARYFELSNGQPYVPIGFNLVGAPDERDFETVVGHMADNGINYCRLWIGAALFDAESSRSGEYDAAAAARLKRFLGLAGARGIRVKLCLEYFRDIPPQKRLWSDRPWHHVANGGPFTSMDDFLNSARGRQQFKRKLAWYAAQIGDDPAVFAWELWNEMNCVGVPWIPWTQAMLPELHRLFPRNLAVQSLGSFDHGPFREQYRALCALPGNDVAQVHRYLDLGARLEVCHGPVDVLAADAVRELLAFGAGKPVILTETGAVKPRHTGASELYARDKDGILLHDMLFAPFFSGAAGTGHPWFWREAIERPDLWYHFARFAAAIAEVDPPAEHFVPVAVAHERLRVYALRGDHVLLAWCRDGRSDWRTELEAETPPEPVRDARLDLGAWLGGRTVAAVRFYDPWEDSWQRGDSADVVVKLPQLSRSLVVRVDL